LTHLDHRHRLVLPFSPAVLLFVHFFFILNVIDGFSAVFTRRTYHVTSFLLHFPHGPRSYARVHHLFPYRILPCHATLHHLRIEITRTRARKLSCFRPGRRNCCYCWYSARGRGGRYGVGGRVRRRPRMCPPSHQSSIGFVACVSTCATYVTRTYD